MPAELKDSDFTETNIEAITAYLCSGDKACACRLGFELEQFVVTDSGASVSYSGPGGIEELLHQLRHNYEAEMREGAHLLGLARPETTLTLEPGAQVEISTGPFCRIHQIEESYTQFAAEIEAVLSRRGQRLLATGYRPDRTADEVELIPKDRYRFMDAYFQHTGTRGRQMMRGSASTQVSIDYSGEADALLKMRLATLLGPLFALATDTVTVLEAAPAPRRLARTLIWDEVDPDRCMTVAGLFDPDFTFARYARTLYTAPLIVGPRDDGGSEDVGAISAAELYAGRQMERADIEHLLSMFFFDVRLKNYVEIRMADSLPIDYALAYTALIRGLFYEPQTLAALSDELALPERSAADVACAKAALAAAGYDAQIFDRTAAEWLDELVELARRGLPDDEQHYLDPLAALIARRLSPRDVPGFGHVPAPTSGPATEATAR